MASGERQWERPVLDDDPEELSWEARVALQNSSPTLLPSERQPPEPSGAGRATKLRAEADEKMDDEAYDEAARAYELAAQQTEEAAEHAKSWQEAAELRALAENARELAALEALEEEAEAGAAAGGPGQAPAPAADDAGLGRNALFLKMQKRAVAESAAEKAGLDGDDEPDSIRGRPGAVAATRMAAEAAVAARGSLEASAAVVAVRAATPSAAAQPAAAAGVVTASPPSQRVDTSVRQDRAKRSGVRLPGLRRNRADAGTTSDGGAEATQEERPSSQEIDRLTRDHKSVSQDLDPAPTTSPRSPSPVDSAALYAEASHAIDAVLARALRPGSQLAENYKELAQCSEVGRKLSKQAKSQQGLGEIAEGDFGIEDDLSSVALRSPRRAAADDNHGIEDEDEVLLLDGNGFTDSDGYSDDDFESGSQASPRIASPRTMMLDHGIPALTALPAHDPVATALQADIAVLGSAELRQMIVERIERLDRLEEERDALEERDDVALDELGHLADTCHRLEQEVQQLQLAEAQHGSGEGHQGDRPAGRVSFSQEADDVALVTPRPGAAGGAGLGRKPSMMFSDDESSDEEPEAWELVRPGSLLDLSAPGPGVRSKLNVSSEEMGVLRHQAINSAGRAAKLRAEADEMMEDEAYDQAAQTYELAANADPGDGVEELLSLAENARELAALEGEGEVDEGTGNAALAAEIAAGDAARFTHEAQLALHRQKRSPPAVSVWVEDRSAPASPAASFGTPVDHIEAFDALSMPPAMSVPLSLQKKAPAPLTVAVSQHSPAKLGSLGLDHVEAFDLRPSVDAAAVTAAAAAAAPASSETEVRVDAGIVLMAQDSTDTMVACEHEEAEAQAEAVAAQAEAVAAQAEAGKAVAVAAETASQLKEARVGQAALEMEVALLKEEIRATKEELAGRPEAADFEALQRQLSEAQAAAAAQSEVDTSGGSDFNSSANFAQATLAKVPPAPCPLPLESTVTYPHPGGSWRRSRRQTPPRRAALSWTSRGSRRRREPVLPRPWWRT
jgi:hypothetical protein